MKIPLIAAFLAVALTGAASLFSKSTTESSATPSDRPIRLKVDVDRGVLPAGSTERAVVKIGLDCVPPKRHAARAPVNLALVIDRSGSMHGDKIAQAREAALALVRRLGPDDVISIIAFDTEVRTLVPARRVGTGDGLEAAIARIQAGGDTALHGGVMRGAAEVRRHVGEVGTIDRVILLSDGQANVGPSSPEELGRLGHALMKEGIAVTTIGLGLGFNEDLMTRLAQRSDGNTYFVENSNDLPGIFAHELGDVLNVVARRVVIEIDFPEGVRPIHFVGRDGSIRGQRAEVTLNQLYGGQEKYALVEVEVSPERDGREREIARARVNYEDALTQRSASVTAQRNVTFSAEEKVVVASANHQVQADYAANVLAIAKDEAIALVDSGRRHEAAELMRQRSAELREIGQVYGNSLVAASAASAAPEADRLDREGLDNAQRKSYRTEAQQAKNQQSSWNSHP
ncbi:MAG TPA: VWA domain-containing protein [Lacunisphaera sp.]|nr:VWA domain-containing protein [Lacunisphaera sp.]